MKWGCSLPRCTTKRYPRNSPATHTGSVPLRIPNSIPGRAEFSPVVGPYYHLQEGNVNPPLPRPILGGESELTNGYAYDN
jgi:hypothetical protein